ncbi:Flagellar assembly protein FliH [Oxalobacteraceae bacterium IMCC9480]|jgi:flagellar assembly protein FliH|nr:Flagellar assembly protein FliH [Oxalobacteraceae bacterium IMCC9480]NDP58773.1 flagellar assembly protein FliH [Oxalobacteraceae bacterium]
MSDAIIPKERQSAYQRWEMDSFGDNRPSAQPQAPAAPPIPRVTIEEQAAIREAAQIKGYATGLTDGRTEGLRLGREEAHAEIDHLRQIAVALGSEAAIADELISVDVMRLALDLAQAMLKTALEIKPELVLPIVAEAIRYLPNVQQPALLYLHPDDARLVREEMHDELDKAGWRIADDSQMQRGGCRIDTASNQIDASIETRWQRLTDALGQTPGWLKE